MNFKRGHIPPATLRFVKKTQLADYNMLQEIMDNFTAKIYHTGASRVASESKHN